MRSRIRDIASRLLPAAADSLLGTVQQCRICGGAVGSVTVTDQDVSGNLEPTVRAVRRVLCRRCLDSIPWIRDIRCEICGRAAACPDCARRIAPNLTMNRAAVQYDTRMKEWLAAYKYRGHERMQPIFALMLDYAFNQLVHAIQHSHATEPYLVRTSSGHQRNFRHLSQFIRESMSTVLWPRQSSGQPTKISKQPFNPLITFVPISESRLQERGFNQAARLAEDLAEKNKLLYHPTLRRIRHTDRQSLKTRRERLQDLKGALDIEPSVRSSYSSGEMDRFSAIIIVDDVYTTGSTLHECAKVLKAEFPVPIYGLTWAR